jgi:hypothetical protein
MVPVTIQGVLRTCPKTGARIWAGWTTEETAPEGLLLSPVDALEPGDGSTVRWLLMGSAAVPQLDAAAMATMSADEPRRCAVAKLSDAELATTGLTRE